ncbi:MAG: hypothetical protein DRH34_03240, partial [Deltaproteobacteria bacterium]
MKQMKTFTFITGILFLLVLFPLASHAQVPGQMNYQGYLTDTDGKPLDGNYTMAFALYTVSAGGTAFWNETQAISVAGGTYNVILGQLGTELDPVDFDGDIYLGVTIESDAEMEPRQKLTSTAFALKAAV